MSATPCNELLARHSRLDHERLRELADGKCPICDPSVPRETYYAILARITKEPELRLKVTRTA